MFVLILLSVSNSSLAQIDPSQQAVLNAVKQVAPAINPIAGGTTALRVCPVGQSNCGTDLSCKNKNYGDNCNCSDGNLGGCGDGTVCCHQ